MRWRTGRCRSRRLQRQPRRSTRAERRYCGASVAEFNLEGLAGSEVEKAVGHIVANEDSAGGAKDEEGGDACTHGARRTYRREYDGAPYSRAQGGVCSNDEPQLVAVFAGNDKRGDVLRAVGAGCAEGAFAEELIRSEGLDAAGVATGG